MALISYIDSAHNDILVSIKSDKAVSDASKEKLKSALESFAVAHPHFFA
jgi:hypothetical protein